jgi:hypothetical protein
MRQLPYRPAALSPHRWSSFGLLPWRVCSCVRKEATIGRCAPQEMQDRHLPIPRSFGLSEDKARWVMQGLRAFRRGCQSENGAVATGTSYVSRAFGVGFPRAGDRGRWMQMMAESVGLAARSARGTINETMPDPERRPPGHPPREPIIIKISRRLPEAPEINRSDDEKGRAVRSAQRMRSTAIIR